MFVVVILSPGTKFRKQADFEKSFFGNGQGEAVDFGADQCTASNLRHFIPCQYFPFRYTCAQ